MTINISTWAAFWLCLAVLLVIEAGFIRMGFNGLIFAYKTPNELELQQVIIQERRSKFQ